MTNDQSPTRGPRVQIEIVRRILQAASEGNMHLEAAAPDAGDP